MDLIIFTDSTMFAHESGEVAYEKVLTCSAFKFGPTIICNDIFNVIIFQVKLDQGYLGPKPPGHPKFMYILTNQRKCTISVFLSVFLAV